MKCPKCGSERITKDTIMGSDTMDKKRLDCGYFGPVKEFQKESSEKQTN